MKFSPNPVLATVFLAVLTCSSCDDPKWVERRENQKAEIAKLKGEIALIDEKLKSLPPNVSGDLAEAKKVSEKQSAEIAGLETEVAALEARKKSLQAEFDAHRVKYRNE